MYTNLKWMAVKLLSETGKRKVFDFIEEGKPEAAKKVLLKAIDIYYEITAIDFAEAAEYYNLLDLSLERASQFPQIH